MGRNVSRACLAVVRWMFPADNFPGVCDLWLVTKEVHTCPWKKRLSMSRGSNGSHTISRLRNTVCPRLKNALAVARQFLRYLGKQGVDAGGAAAAHEKAFLIHRLNAYRKRHGHEPGDLSGWRWSQTSGMHMVMRLAQGQWPPVTSQRAPRKHSARLSAMLMHGGFQTFAAWQPLPSGTVEPKPTGFSNHWVKEEEHQVAPCPDHRCRPRSLHNEPGSATAEGHSPMSGGVSAWISALSPYRGSDRTGSLWHTYQSAAICV